MDFESGSLKPIFKELQNGAIIFVGIFIEKRFVDKSRILFLFKFSAWDDPYILAFAGEKGEGRTWGIGSTTPLPAHHSLSVMNS